MKRAENDDLEENFTGLLGYLDKDAQPPDAGFLGRLREESGRTFSEYAARTTSRRASGGLFRLRRWMWMAAATAALIASVFIWRVRREDDGNAVAHAAERLLQVHTLHWREVYVESYGPNREMERVVSEKWKDYDRGHSRIRILGEAKDDQGRRINDVEGITNGRYQMTVNHHHRSVGSSWQSPLQEKADVRWGRNDVARRFGMIDVDRLRTFQKVSTEAVGDVPCVLWRGSVPTPSMSRGSKSSCHVRAWISVETGLFRKIMLDYEGSRNAQGQIFDVLEMNDPIPEEFFHLEAPADYILREKEKADKFECGFGIGVLWVYLVFTMKDGALIVCWNVPKGVQVLSGPQLPSDLPVGGPMPNLQYRIRDISTIGAGENEIHFKGRHLAGTTKDGVFYEWSLFVPEKPPPPRERFFGYTFEWSRTDQSPNLPPHDGSGQRDLDDDFQIESPEDFNTFVLGAMAEYSDSGSAPAHITGDGVTALSKKIQEER